MALMAIPSSAQNLFAEFGSLRGSDGFGSTTTITSPEKIGKTEVKATRAHNVSEMDLFTCSYCQESTLCEEDGVLVCTSCGRESGNVITAQQEWRNHSDSRKGDPSRCGMPVHPLLPQASLGTVAQGYGKQGFRRLQMQSAMPSNERALLEAIKIIKGAALELNIPMTLADKACFLYAKLIKDMKIKRGPVRKAVMANCQYAICKREDSGFYVSAEKLVKGYHIEMKKYNEGAKLFDLYSYHKTHGRARCKKWDKEFSSSRKTFVKPTSPENITEDACRKLAFDDHQTAEVTYIVRQVTRLKLVSARMPQSIAAGCLILYVKARKFRGANKISISQIAKICVVSDATAKNTYNELKVGKSFLLPKASQDLYSGKVGNCMPRVQLEKIYTAPQRALPKTVILPSSVTKVESNRGRPKGSVADEVYYPRKIKARKKKDVQEELTG